MSDIIERHKDLSKKVLGKDEQKPAEQKASGRNQFMPTPYIFAFSLGAIVGLSLFVLIWIISGFSKIAVTMPLIGGISGMVIEMIRQRNNTR